MWWETPPVNLVIASNTQKQFAALFGEYHEYSKSCFKRVWEERPNRIIFIANLGLEEIDVSKPFRQYKVREDQILMSIAETSMAARSIHIPFWLITPGWGDTPTTPVGMTTLLAEDVVLAPRRTIVRVNGLFGPEVDNRVARIVLSDNPMADDSRIVNPVSARSLATFVLMHSSDELPDVIRLGDEPGSWYDYFSRLHPKVRPWMQFDTVRYKQREVLQVARRYSKSVAAGTEYEPNWDDNLLDRFSPPYSALSELRLWLKSEGHELMR